MAMLSKGRRPDNFESYNPLNLALDIFEVFIGILLGVNL